MVGIIQIVENGFELVQKDNSSINGKDIVCIHTTNEECSQQMINIADKVELKRNMR